MRIVIDMQGAQTDSRFRGIGRYTLSLVQALVRNKAQHDIVLVLNGRFEHTIDPLRQAFKDILQPEKIVVWAAPGPMGSHAPQNQGRHELAVFLRESFMASLSPDIVIITSFFEGFVDDAVTSVHHYDIHTPVCVIAYDFIPLLNPLQYLDPHPDYADYYKKKVQQFQTADVFLAISESSRLETVNHLNVPPLRTCNISGACEPFFKPMTIQDSEQQSLMNKWGLNRDFILYTGGADERKNLPRLIQAFASLPVDLQQSHQILFAGKFSDTQKSELMSIANAHGLGQHVLLFTGFISDLELVMAYNLCRLFIFPSWHEGFGLPPLEAMACGAPTIAANTSSMPEVIGWQDALFDPLDVGSIAQKMYQSLTDAAFRALLVEHAHRQAKKFSWDSSALLTLQAIESVVQAENSEKSLAQQPSGSIVQTSQSLLRAAVQVLQKHSMLSDNDVDSLAACMAQNEQQLGLPMPTEMTPPN